MHLQYSYLKPLRSSYLMLYSYSNSSARNEQNLSLFIHPHVVPNLYDFISSMERDTFMVLFVILKFHSPSQTYMEKSGYSS